MDVTGITGTAKRILELTAQHIRETLSPITPALRHAENALADQVPERELRIAARIAAASCTTAGAYTIQALRDPTTRVRAINRAIQLIGAGECSDAHAEQRRYPTCQTLTYTGSPPSSRTSRTKPTRLTGVWPSAWTVMLGAARLIRPTLNRARRHQVL